MKKHIILLTALISAFTLNLLANPNRMIVRFEKGETAKTINVRLANLEKIRTQLLIQDMNGTVWFSKQISGKHAFANKLNLSSIPENDYIILVTNRNGEYVKSFNLGELDIVFFEDKEGPSNDNGFVNLVSANPQEKGRLISETTVLDKQEIGLRLANLQCQPTTVQLMKLGKTMVFEQGIIHEIGYSTKFNLKGMAEGSYLLYVEACDASVVQFFTFSKKGIEMGSSQRMERPEMVSKPIKLVGN